MSPTIIYMSTVLNVANLLLWSVTRCLSKNGDVASLSPFLPCLSAHDPEID